MKDLTFESVKDRKRSRMEVKRDLVVKKSLAKIDNKYKNETEVVEEAENRNVQDPKLLSSIYNYLVVLSIILIIFAAFRNSVTW